MLHEQAPVLHDIDPRRDQPVRHRLVADAELHPHGARVLGEDVVEVSGHVARSPEHVDQVDVARDADQAAVDRPAEDGRDLGVVDRHRDDVEPRADEILWHGERGLIPLRLRLDPKDGDTPRAGQKVVDVRVGLESAAGRHEPAKTTTARRVSESRGRDQKPTTVRIAPR